MSGMQEVLNICDDDRDHGGERSKVTTSFLQVKSYTEVQYMNI